LIGAVELVPDSAELGVADESELVRAAQVDGSSFDELYRRHVGRIYRYVRTQVEVEQDALDLTQLVFLRALEALPRYRSSAPFGAWLFRIARNAVIDNHRLRRPTASWDYLPARLIPESGDDIEGTSARNESLRELSALIADLDPYRRELILLRFAGELTTREIATVLGKPESTIKSDIRRTLLRMKGSTIDRG